MSNVNIEQLVRLSPKDRKRMRAAALAAAKAEGKWFRGPTMSIGEFVEYCQEHGLTPVATEVLTDVEAGEFEIRFYVKELE